jgi:uncharacterized membrane protein
MSKSVKFFVALSVLLNIAFAGVIVGHIGHHLVSADNYHRKNIDKMSELLPEDRREHFSSVMHKVEDETGEQRQQLSDARKQMMQLLKTDPFDKSAFIAEAQKMGGIYGQIMQYRVEAIADLAGEYPAEDRVRLADMLPRSGHREKPEK